MAKLIFIDSTDGKEYPIPEIKSISLELEVDCDNESEIFLTSDCEISFTSNFDSSLFLALIGIKDTNNWRKMHGGVMSRKVKR